MSVAREAKRREWLCNIFTQGDEKPMFDRKKRDDRSVTPTNGFTHRRDTSAILGNENGFMTRSNNFMRENPDQGMSRAKS